MKKSKEHAKVRQKPRLIIDDHAMVREGVAQIIEHTDDLCVCYTASTANEGLEMLRKLKPDQAKTGSSSSKMPGLCVLTS